MFLTFLEDWKPLIVVAGLIFFWIWESIGFYFPPRDRWRHAARNMVVALVNSALISLVLAGLTLTVAELTAAEGLGILRMAGLQGAPLILLSFLVLDVWMYWWHRLNHRIPFLWRFHRMHHSDPSVDVTTATRFHFGEIILSSALRLVLILLFGIPLEAVILFDGIQLPVIYFHHANISLPRPLDRILCFVLVTPFMHKVHHSRVQRETDSNYSSVLSLWDRIFGSFVELDSYQNIRFGIKGFDEPERQSLKGFLITPFFPLSEERDNRSDEEHR